jgi:hypothetical protein
MDDTSECVKQIKKVVGNAMELLSEEKQKQVILMVCSLIKEQRSEIHQHDQGLSEEQAVSTCGISDEALAEQERILEEVITKHHINKGTHYDFEKHRRKPSQ